jgi:hypothetical protein
MSDSKRTDTSRKEDSIIENHTSDLASYSMMTYQCQYVIASYSMRIRIDQCGDIDVYLNNSVGMH